MDPEIGVGVGVEEDINSLISKTEELKGDDLANFLTSQLDKGGQREELYSLTPQIGRLSQRLWNSTPDSLKSIGWLKKSSGGNSLLSAETRTVFGSKATIIGPHPHTEDTTMHYLFNAYRFTVSFDKSGNFVVPDIDPEHHSELFTLIKGETIREYMNALISHNKVNKEYMGRLVASFPELNETWIKAITNINTEETTIDLPEKTDRFKT